MGVGAARAVGRDARFGGSTVWVATLLTLSAFGVAVTSALLPPVNLELYLIGLVLKAPQLPWWLLAVVVAVGQLSGKLVYFQIGRGTLNGRTLLRRSSRVRPIFLRLRLLYRTVLTRVRASALLRRLRPHRADTPSRVRGWMDRIREQFTGTPTRTAGFLLFSAFTSLPPFAWVVVAAGAARVPLRTFLVTGLVGRIARFGLVAIGPVILAGRLG